MRTVISFDSNWKFIMGDLFPRNGADGWSGAKAKDNNFGAASPDFDDSGWSTIDLPHDYLIDTEYTTTVKRIHPYAMQGERTIVNSRLIAGGCLEPVPAWYRKWLKFRPENPDQRVFLHFDGVFRDCLLFVNAYYVKRHESGYDSFYVDITDFLDFEKDNLIAVRVDPTRREGWWYEGAGIYRHVWLEISGGIRFAPHGIYVCPDVNLEENKADIRISAEMQSFLYTDEDVGIEWEICDKDGNILISGSGKSTLPCRDSSTMAFETTLENPILWDIQKPYLYSLKARLYHNGVPLDEVSTPFGVRHTYFDSNKGFFLNGRHVKIKGVCCHQDHAGVGIATNKDIYEYRISRLQSMGANAYRTAHHMASPELLEVCDRMGMLVFEEARRMSSCEDDIRSIRTMVKRDRNHPSIFLWGIGNEEIRAQSSPEMARATRAIMYEIKRLDSLRPITSGVVMKNEVKQYDNADFCLHTTSLLDVMGFNYESFAWDDYHQKMPHQPIIVTEATSNSSTRGCYETDKQKGYFYIKDRDNFTKCAGAPEIKRPTEGEEELLSCLEREYLAGIFIWTGFDYRGEPCPVTYPAIMSYFGIFDYCGFPKDNYHYYRSLWQDEPVLHLLPHMNLREAVGRKTDFYAYTNLDSAELFIGDKCVGVSNRGEHGYIRWENVEYSLGTAEVIGYRNGVEALRRTYKTTGKAEKICVAAFRDKIKVGDTAIIDISLTDKDGNTVPDCDTLLKFTVSGSGRFLGCGNGNPSDLSKDTHPERCTYLGLCQLLVKAEQAGKINVLISGGDFEDKPVTIEVTQ